MEGRRERQLVDLFWPGSDSRFVIETAVGKADAPVLRRKRRGTKKAESALKGGLKKDTTVRKLGGWSKGSPRHLRACICK